MRRSGMVRVVSVVVMLMLGGAIAPAAEAVPAFKASIYPATVHGSSAKGVTLFNTEGGKVECAVNYHGELEEASTTLALAPAFSECEGFGFVSKATVATEGCQYMLHLAESASEDKALASFDVSCEAGKSIKVTAGTCKVEVKSQSGLGSVAITNNTAATPQPDITLDPEVAGIAYTVTQDGFLCPFNGTGSKTGGTLTASSATTLTGQSPSNPETKIGVEVG